MLTARTRGSSAWSRVGTRSVVATECYYVCTIAQQCSDGSRTRLARGEKRKGGKTAFLIMQEKLAAVVESKQQVLCCHGKAEKMQLQRR